MQNNVINENCYDNICDNKIILFSKILFLCYLTYQKERMFIWVFDVMYKRTKNTCIIFDESLLFCASIIAWNYTQWWRWYQYHGYQKSVPMQTVFEAVIFWPSDGVPCGFLNSSSFKLRLMYCITCKWIISVVTTQVAKAYSIHMIFLYRNQNGLQKFFFGLRTTI